MVLSHAVRTLSAFLSNFYMHELMAVVAAVDGCFLIIHVLIFQRMLTTFCCCSRLGTIGIVYQFNVNETAASVFGIHFYPKMFVEFLAQTQICMPVFSTFVSGRLLMLEVNVSPFYPFCNDKLSL